MQIENGKTLFVGPTFLTRMTSGNARWKDESSSALSSVRSVCEARSKLHTHKENSFIFRMLEELQRVKNKEI